MRKFFLTIIIFILVIGVIVPIYADDVEENNITDEELREIVETMANTINAPVINSRNAIIYDRTSR